MFSFKIFVFKPAQDIFRSKMDVIYLGLNEDMENRTITENYKDRGGLQTKIPQ